MIGQKGIFILVITFLSLGSPIHSLTWEEVFEAISPDKFDFPANAKNKNVTCWKKVYWEEYIEFPEQQIHKIERHYGLKPWDVSFDYYENGVKQKKQVLPFQKKKVMAHADYETVFTNYEEIQSWFQ